MSKKTKKCRIFKDGNSWCCVGPKFKNIQESASGFGDTAEEAYNDYLTDVTAMKAAKKLLKSAKHAKKFEAQNNKVGTRNHTVTEQAKVLFIKGLTSTQVKKALLAFNLTMECPLGNKEVNEIYTSVSKMKSWIEHPKKKKSDKASRNTRIQKCIVKAFKNGANRAGVINLALIKNGKFKTPLCPAEVTNLVRIEWERLNPPSK
jgi:hypothetical protein